jgi:hypothetical protein
MTNERRETIEEKGNRTNKFRTYISRRGRIKAEVE